MTRRAAPAARPLAPLAILVPGGAMPVAFVRASRTGAAAALLVAARGFAAPGVVTGHVTYGARLSVATAIVTWLAVPVATEVAYAVDIDTSACGKMLAGTWNWLSPAAGALGFLAIAAFSALIAAVLPGPHGTCET